MHDTCDYTWRRCHGVVEGERTVITKTVSRADMSFPLFKEKDSYCRRLHAFTRDVSCLYLKDFVDCALWLFEKPFIESPVQWVSPHSCFTVGTLSANRGAVHLDIGTVQLRDVCSPLGTAGRLLQNVSYA